MTHCNVLSVMRVLKLYNAWNKFAKNISDSKVECFTNKEYDRNNYNSKVYELN